MQDVIEQFIQSTLAPLGVPVSQTPGDASADTWLTWNTVLGRAITASDSVIRVRHMFQLHAYTHGVASEHRAVFFAAVDALRAAGVRVYAWGADEREKDTGICHIACTCIWTQKDGV